MRKGFYLASFCLAATTALGVLAPTASAAPVKAAPSITSGQVCAAYPPQLVAQKLGKQKPPVASPGYSSKFTSADFAVYCSYRFSAASVLNIVFYGPARPVAELSGKKIPRPRPIGAFTGQPSSYVRLRALSRVPGQYWRANSHLRPEFIDCPRVVRHAAHPLTGFRI